VLYFQAISRTGTTIDAGRLRRKTEQQKTGALARVVAAPASER
jgi:hypothetical protein